jgi:hypothetical protein
MPEATQPQLVSALNSWSIVLADLGRHSESQVAAAEAITLAQRLAETDPDEYASAVAMTHNTLCASLSILDRHDEALAA